MESRVVDLIRNMNRFLCSNCRGTRGGVRVSVNEITSGATVEDRSQFRKIETRVIGEGERKK